MILDLHVHSTFSGDSPTSPEDYARRLVELQSDYEVDGFVLMEHNYLITPPACDLVALSERYGLTILAGVEVDTYWGHLLVYGISEELWLKIMENKQRKQEPIWLCRLVAQEGGVAVPAHPFRFFIGMGERSVNLPGVNMIETLNGSNSEPENRAAVNFARKMGWPGIGGSDSHFPAELGKALTRFPKPVRSMADLVAELKAGHCQALFLEQARKANLLTTSDQKAKLGER